MAPRQHFHRHPGHHPGHLPGRRQHTAQAGVSLLEVLITMVVAALALLGIMGLQLSTVKFQAQASHTTLATEQARALMERMRSNNVAFRPATTPGATLLYTGTPGYANAAPGGTPAQNCITASCSPAELAAFDVAQWRNRLAETLPGGRGVVLPHPLSGAAEPGARTVVVMWRNVNNVGTGNATGGTQADVADPACPETAPPAGIRCLTFTFQP
jgi:type IV pilus assembly protein PilV